MQTEKRLIVYSFIALLIGVASITPLLLFMSASAKAETPIDTPWFNLTVPYVSWTANSTENSNGTVTYGEWHKVTFNVSLNSEASKQVADARIEYFQIQVYTDKVPIDNLTYFVGLNRSAAFGSLDSLGASFHFVRENWFDTNTSGGGMFSSNFTGMEFGLLGGAHTGVCDSSSWLNSTLSKEIYNIKNAQVIYVDLRRLGSVIFNGNFTTVTLSNNEVLQRIELEKIGDGFLYGNIPTENQLPQPRVLSPSQVPEPET